MSPAGDEREAREEIDRLLTAAGWHVCDMGQQNEYLGEQAVAWRVIVNRRLFHIQTRISKQGPEVEPGYSLQIQGRASHKQCRKAPRNDPVNLHKQPVLRFEFVCRTNYWMRP